MKQFLRKVLSLYFDFFLKQILGSERERLSHHRLLLFLNQDLRIKLLEP